MILRQRVVQFFTRPPMRRDGIVLLASIMFAVGLALYLTTDLIMGWRLVLVCSLLALVMWHYEHHIKAVCLVLMLAGYYYAQIYGVLWGTPFLDREGVLFEVPFTVESMEAAREGGVRLLIRLDRGRAGLKAGHRLQLETEPENFPRLEDQAIIQEVSQRSSWKIGEHYTANLLVYRPEERFLDPNGYKRLQAYYRGVSGYAVILGQATPASDIFIKGGKKENFEGNKPTLYERTRAWFANLQAELRARVRNTAGIYFSGDVSGIVRALLLGEVTAIDVPLYEKFRSAGLAHLFAVSGLHIGMVVGGTLLLVQTMLRRIYPITRRMPLKHFAIFAALVAGGFYLFLSGGSVSGVRAYVFCVFALFAYMADRRVFTFRTLGFAVFIILMLSPASLLTAGFQLSFVVAGALLLVYEVDVRTGVPHRHLRGKKGQGVTANAKAAVITAGTAQLAAAPITLAQFQSVSLVGFGANILVVPMVAGILFPLMVTMFVLVVLTASLPAEAAHTLGAILAWPLDQILNFFVSASEAVGALSFAEWHIYAQTSTHAPVVLLPFLAAFLYAPCGGGYYDKHKKVGVFIACALTAASIPVYQGLLLQREGRELLLWGRLPQAAVIDDGVLKLYGVRRDSQRERALAAYAGENAGQSFNRLGGACSNGLCLFELEYQQERVSIAYVKSAERMMDACGSSQVVIAATPVSSDVFNEGTQHYTEFSDSYLSAIDTAQACGAAYREAFPALVAPFKIMPLGADFAVDLGEGERENFPIYIAAHDLAAYGGVRFTLRQNTISNETMAVPKAVLTYEALGPVMPQTPQTRAPQTPNLRPWQQ